MSTMRITAADRGPDGKIRIEPERPLVDLLPPVDQAAPAEQPAEAFARPRLNWQTLGGLVGGLAVAGLLIYVIGVATPPRPAANDRPVSAPFATSAEVPQSGEGVTKPSPFPAATPSAAPLVPVAAFWSPGGDPAGTVDPAAITGTTARYGETWIAVQLVGGGNVWIARGQLPSGVAVNGPDLEPTTAPVIITRDKPGPPVPAPTVCASVGTSDADRVTKCGYDLDALDSAARAEYAERVK